MREFLRAPGLGMRLVNLPGYSPDFNGDEAIWGWAREEATGNLCLGAGPRCRRGSAASSPVWPAGAARSNGAAGRCCNRGPKRSCPIPGVRQMHIPPWPWFRFFCCNVCAVEAWRKHSQSMAVGPLLWEGRDPIPVWLIPREIQLPNGAACLARPSVLAFLVVHY